MNIEEIFLKIQDISGVIKTEIPERTVGQKDVLQLKSDPIPIVRIAIITQNPGY